MPEDISVVALICIGAIGDLLLAGSAIPAIRKKFPNVKLILFTSATNRALAPLLPECDTVETLPLKDPVKARQLINDCKADIILDFAQWPRVSALFLALSKARFTIGFRTKGQYRHYCYDKIVDHSSQCHEFENFANILRAAGVSEIKWPTLSPTYHARARIDALALRPFVVFHPWAAGVRRELCKWPIGCWRRLAETLIAAGYDIALTGGPVDAPANLELLAGIRADPERLRNFAGALSLDETSALISRAQAAVCVNTGILHIAASLDVPLVGLHGPTSPQRWGPLSNFAISLAPTTPDAGYLYLGFENPRNGKSCMHLIEVESVLKALSALGVSTDATTPISRDFLSATPPSIAMASPDVSL